MSTFDLSFHIDTYIYVGLNSVLYVILILSTYILQFQSPICLTLMVQYNFSICYHHMLCERIFFLDCFPFDIIHRLHVIYFYVCWKTVRKTQTQCYKNIQVPIYYIQHAQGRLAEQTAISTPNIKYAIILIYTIQPFYSFPRLLGQKYISMRPYLPYIIYVNLNEPRLNINFLC